MYLYLSNKGTKKSTAKNVTKNYNWPFCLKKPFWGSQIFLGITTQIYMPITVQNQPRIIFFISIVKVQYNILSNYLQISFCIINLLKSTAINYIKKQ